MRFSTIVHCHPQTVNAPDTIGLERGGLAMDNLFDIMCVFERASVAQLDSASVFGTEGWGFESLRA